MIFLYGSQHLKKVNVTVSSLCCKLILTVKMNSFINFVLC